MVLGGSPYRTLHAAALLQEGMAPEIWQTGWTDEKHRLPEGIADESAYLMVTHSTWEDGQAIAALARVRHVQRILVVTDWFHSRRALCVLQHHLRGSNVAISYTPVSQPPESLNSWWWWEWRTREHVLSELGKLLYYWIRYGVPFWKF